VPCALHLPALAVDVLVKMLRRTLERGDDVAGVDLLAHAGRGGLSGVRLQRTFEPRHHFARLAAFGMMEAQIVTCASSAAFAGEAENIVVAVIFRSLHRFDVRFRRRQHAGRQDDGTLGFGARAVGAQADSREDREDSPRQARNRGTAQCVWTRP
jgi:hypothetical protein